MAKRNDAVKMVLSVDERNRLTSFFGLLIVIHKRAPAPVRRAAKKVSDPKAKQPRLKTKMPANAFKCKAGFFFIENYFIIAANVASATGLLLKGSIYDRYHSSYAQYIDVLC